MMKVRSLLKSASFFVILLVILTGPVRAQSVFTSGFNTGADGFVYGDDAFGGTNASAYESGGYVSGGGFSGGGLRVLLGGVDDSTVVGMSGGWSRQFSLSTQTLVRVSLRYRLVFQGTYEGDECGRALVSVDGVALSPDGTGVLRQFCGADPQTDVVLDSGWQQAIFEVSLAAGSHTIKVGGLNTKKTRVNEYTEVYFDDIELRQLNVDPQVVLAPQALSFSMVQGGVAASQVLQVDTSDAQAMAYTLSDNAGWLTVTPVSGQTPAQVTVSVNGVGLAVGTYNAVITASAGGYTAGTCTVTLIVSSVDPVVFTSGFDAGADGFVYGDDAFGGASAPLYESGGYVSGGGFSGGGLRVLLGGVDDSTVVGMSGGWSRQFSLPTQTLLRVSLRYRLVFQGTYEGDECSRSLVSVDGVALSPDGTGVLRQFCGADPQTNVVLDSGWQQAIFEVSLAAGSHTIKVGGLNTKKTRANEYTEVYFDDIELRQLNSEPQVVLTPQALSFSMIQGGVAAAQVLQADTSDAQAVAYTLSDNAGWLTVTPVSGQTPAQVTVSVNGVGLAVGTYNAVITASAAGYAAGTCTVTLSVTTSGVLFSDGFEDGNANGWSIVNDSGQSSQWQVVGGQYKQTNSQVGAFYESYLLGSFAVYSNGDSLADYDARVTIYPSQNIAVSSTDSVGLMFRYRDQNNYYRFCVSRSQGFSRLEKRTNGVFRTLASDGRGFDMDQPIELLVCVKGSVILVYYNGEPRFAAEDPDHSTGTIALLTNGIASFDDVVISANKVDPKVVLSEPGSYSIVTTESVGATIFTSGFDTGADGFVYGDDAFGVASAPLYESGGYVSGGGFSGGGLRVLLGGVDDSTVVGMSGGWSRQFSLPTQTLLRVSLRYRLVFQGTYEGDECSRALVSVDGVALSPDGTGVLRQFCGADPQTDVVLDSGWQQAIFEVSLAAGSHTIKVGGLNTKKTRINEYTEVYFDDIELADTGGGGGGSSRYKLPARAVAMNLPLGAGVRFTLDKNTPSESRITTYTHPFQADFLEVVAGDHTLEALLVNAQGNPLTGDTTADSDTVVGVGGKYIVAFGDSITAGKGDDFDPDNDSFDGRNLGRGYAPVLNDLVAAGAGFPVTVLNEGLGGTTSSHGALRLQSALERHPKSQIWLIQFGTNDAISGFRSGQGLQPGQAGYDGSFKDFMQQIVEGVAAAGKVPALAKIPVLLAACSDCAPFQDPSTEPLNLLVQKYNTVIDEMVIKNNLLIQPPDFYAYFNANRSEFFDPLHPNGAGYQAMASQWAEKLSESGELSP